MRWSRICTVWLVLMWVGAANAQDTAETWLEGMNQAFRSLAYDGTFSYFTGNDLATLRVVHKVVDGVQRERLVHLNGEPREIVRHGDEVICIVMPGDDLLKLETSIPAGPFARAFVRSFEHLHEQYDLKFHGTDRVVGRDARRIDVVPRDAHRFGYRLWLDDEHRLLLRSELINGQGKRLEIFQFTSLRLGEEVDERELEGRQAEGAMVSHLRLDEKSRNVPGDANVPWHTAWLPAGFQMSASDIRRAPAHLGAVHTLMYTDGLSAFSVFVEAMPEEGAHPMMMRKGATVSVSRHAAGPDGATHLVTLVGELPDDTAKRILASIQPAS